MQWLQHSLLIVQAIVFASPFLSWFFHKQTQSPAAPFSLVLMWWVNKVFGLIIKNKYVNNLLNWSWMRKWSQSSVSITPREMSTLQKDIHIVKATNEKSMRYLYINKSCCCFLTQHRESPFSCCLQISVTIWWLWISAPYEPNQGMNLPWFFL